MESFPIVAESYSNMQFFSSDDGTAMGNTTGSGFSEDFRLRLHLMDIREGSEAGSIGGKQTGIAP
jgi:hypothetical protein